MRKTHTLRLGMVLAMLLSFILNIQAQCPPANRTLNNCKAGTNDEIGAVFTLFFQGEGISTAAWKFESGGTFFENGDGTADLTAVLYQIAYPSRRFQANIHFISQTYNPPAGSPVLMNTHPSTTGWYYYDWGTSVLTGLDDLAGAVVNLTKRGKFAQLGIGGADQVPDTNNFGMSAWFNWEVIQQPTNTALVINDFPANPSIDQGDLCLVLSGTPTVCIPTGQIGGQVYCDDNKNSNFDNGESTLTNLTVTLCDSASNIITTADVDGNGKFLFDKLKAGKYNVKFPATTNDGKPLLTSSPILVYLSDGQQFISADAGYNCDPCLKDKEAPKINCPNDITLTTSNNCAKATWNTPTATDDLGVDSVVQTEGPTSGSCFPIGKTKITYKVTDKCGKSTCCSFYVIVKPACDINFDANKCYRIVNKCSGLALDVSGACLDNDAAVVQWKYLGGSNQQWQIVPTTNGFFKLVARHSGKVLACHYQTSGSKVYQYDFYTGGAKEWKIECVGNNCYRLVHRLSGKVLDVPNNSKSAGCQLQIWNANDGDNQTWQIVEVPCNAPVYYCNPKVTFNNRCNFPCIVYWDNNGTKVKYGTINGGQNWSCKSYSGHKWIICNASTGAQVCSYTVNGCNEQVCDAKPPSCDVTFCNRSSSSCKVYYFNNYGQKVFYKTLSYNQSCNKQTSFGEKWLVCDRDDKPISNYTINKYGSSWCNVYSSSSSWRLVGTEQLEINGQYEEGRVKIDWVSNTAFKTDYFALQRQDKLTGEFQDLKLLNSIKDTDELSYYNEYDDNPVAGENVYRIKAVNLDGTISYSQLKTIKSVHINQVRLYPNPATDNLDVNLTGYEGQDVELTIYNGYGMQVGNYKIQSAPKDQIRLDVSSYNAGTYMLRISAPSKKDLTQKFFIQ